MVLCFSVSVGILHVGTMRDSPSGGARVVELLVGSQRHLDASFEGCDRGLCCVVSEAAAFHALGMSLEEEPCEWYGDSWQCS